MFHLSNRRYTGAKTKLLSAIDESILRHFDYRKCENLSFFDVFAGTGVVSEYFMRKNKFKSFIINDFLHSNYALYQGFFKQEAFNQDKLETIKQDFLALNSKKIKQNYYSKYFGDKFFSQKDSLIIGEIREEIDNLFKNKTINQKEFYILLTSLIYSSDRVANTCGHYDAYRKNVKLEDRFIFELIKPLNIHKNIHIFKQDSNALVIDLVKLSQANAKDLKKASLNIKFPIDISFLDPPYNSRQYSRFYHLLETLSTNDKPELFGVALKPKPKNLSKYCKVEAKEVLKDLVQNLAKISKIIVLTYNNTYTSKSSSSQNKIQLHEIKEILESVGQSAMFEYDFKAFSSGKTDFTGHKEMIFISRVR